MADQLFGSVEEPALGADQANEVNVDLVKQKFTKEDGSVDVDGLLKKAAHADSHINKLEKKLDDTTAEVNRRMTYEDMLTQIKEQRTPASNQAPQGDEERGGNQSQVIPNDELITAKVKEILTQKQLEDRQADNVAYAARELTKLWGEDFTEKLEQRAKEMHLSKKYLQDLARDNPRGFLNVVIPPAPRQVEDSFSPPQSSQRVTERSSSGVKNWKYYQAMKKSNPDLYSSGTIAVEMDRQALKLGDDFYK